jgi:predicted MFS family arabinose efflux permease
MATRTVPTLRPARDRPTWISYVEISLIAFFTMGYGSTLALLRDEQGTTRTVAGMHAAVLALAGVGAAALVPRLAARWGRSSLIRRSMACMALGILLYTVPAGPLVTLPAIALVGVGFTSAVVGINAFILDHQRGAGPAALTQANALAAVAGFLSPLVVGAGAATILGWRAGLWALVIAIVVAEVIRARVSRVFDVVRAHAGSEGRLRELPSRFWWSCALIGCLSAVEACTFTWSADLLREQAGLGPASAAAGLGAVSAGMVLGRLLGSRLAESISIDALLRLAIAFAGLSVLLAWVARSPALLLACLFLVGLGISVNWPLGVSRVVAASGGRANRGASLASVSGGIAAGTFPFMMGAWADQVGIHTAFLMVPALLLVALTILLAVPMGPSPDEQASEGD